MKSSKLTSKHQVTVPADVRKALGLKAGDRVAFAVEDGKATMRRVALRDAAWLHLVESTLSEWNSPANDEAWDYLSK